MSSNDERHVIVRHIRAFYETLKETFMPAGYQTARKEMGLGDTLGPLEQEYGGWGEDATGFRKVKYAAVYSSAVTAGAVEFYDGNAALVGTSAFAGNAALKKAEIPNCTSVSAYAFNGCAGIESICFPLVEEVGYNAFSKCTSLSRIDLPECKSIGANAFEGCTALSSLSIPKCEYLGAGAIDDTGVKELYAPQVTSTASRITTYNDVLESVDLPSLLVLPEEAFLSCTSLKEARLSACTTVSSGAFNGCASLELVDLPNATDIPNGSSYNAFLGCSSLKTLNIPAVVSLYERNIWSVPALERLYLRDCKGLSLAMSSCPLSVLVLSGSSVCKLGGSNYLSNTSIANKKGYIYVPSSLVSSYKTATNWLYFSARVSAWEDAPEEVRTI